MNAAYQSMPGRSSRETTGRRDRRFKTFLALTFFVLAGIGVAIILAGSRRPTVFQTTFDEIRATPVMEIPAKAVAIVSRADSQDRTNVIYDVLRAVSLSARPGVLPYTVTALLRKFSDNFDAILRSAAELSPPTILILAGAAADTAPDRAEDITFVLSSVAPEGCVPIAVMVGREIPTAKNEILRGLTNAVPRMAASVEVATRVFGVDDFEFVLQNALDRVVSP